MRHDQTTTTKRRTKRAPRATARVARKAVRPGRATAGRIRGPGASTTKKRVAGQVRSPAEKAQSGALLQYDPKGGLLRFADTLRAATPMDLVVTERQGVPARLLKDIAKDLRLPTTRVFQIVGVPRATAERKASANSTLDGAEGQAALGLARLLGLAREILGRSTAPEAVGFDVAEWLGRWIEQPQPALGGQKPSDLLDTPTGIEVVYRLLGAMESGAYL